MLLGEPRLLLAMAFVYFEIKRAVANGVRYSRVTCMATVTLHYITHDYVEHKVQERRGEEDNKSGNHHVIEPRQTADGKADDDNGNAHSLGKVLAGKQVRARTDKALFQSVSSQCPGVDLDRSLAV